METIEKETHTFELIGGALSLDFINTQSNYLAKLTPTHDYFGTYDDILSFAQQVGIITSTQEQKLASVAADSPKQAEFVLTRARSLRAAIRQTLLAAGEGTTPDPDAFDLFNKELAEAMSHARIARTGSSGTGYEWSFQPALTNLESVLWPIVKSAADLLVSDKIARVHQCAGDTCGWMFVDTSKNHSRRWCDMKDCGNNVKARRHYNKIRKQTNS